MFLFFLKAYSSVVERTAHNGFVVGSNPARPIFKSRYIRSIIF
jgi:hypothetical protein